MNKFKMSTLLSIHRTVRNHIRLSSAESHKPNISYYLLLAFPATAFGLGTWQVQRLEWKKGIIREMQARTQGHVIPLPDDILDEGKMKELEYRRISVEGKFDHTKEILLGPRSLKSSGEHAGGGLIGPASRSGFHIVTPFVLSNGDRILINRGWVPIDKKDPSTRLNGQIEDTVRIVGLLRTGEKRTRFTPKVQEGSLNWHYRDLNEFTALLDTLPIFIDADATTTLKDGPIGGQTNVHIRNEHMQYIITWYSLAVATLLLWFQIRKKTGSRSKGRSVYRN